MTTSLANNAAYKAPDTQFLSVAPVVVHNTEVLYEGYERVH